MPLGSKLSFSPLPQDSTLLHVARGPLSISACTQDCACLFLTCSSSLQLALLMELSQNRGGDSYRPFAGSQSSSAFNSIFQNENFQLQLAPPPVAED